MAWNAQGGRVVTKHQQSLSFEHGNFLDSKWFKQNMMEVDGSWWTVKKPAVVLLKPGFWWATSATFPTPEVVTWTRATAMWQGLASPLNMLSALDSEIIISIVNSFVDILFLCLELKETKTHIPNHEQPYLLVFVALAPGPEKRSSPCNFFLAHPWCTCPNNLSKARVA